MSVFKKFAEEEQRKALEAEQQMVLKRQRDLAALEDYRASIQPHYSKLRQFLESQIVDIEKTPFTARFETDDHVGIPALRFKLQFAFKNSSQMPRKQFCYLVSIPKGQQVTAGLYEIVPGSGLRAFERSRQETLGTIDHPDLIPRIEAHLGEVLDFANRTR